MAQYTNRVTNMKRDIQISNGTIYFNNCSSNQKSAKLQPRRSQKSASTDSHEPPQSEFQFMPTPYIIHQSNSGSASDVPGNDLQTKSLSFDNMVDDLQLMEQEEQSRMKAQRDKIE
ncbi:hypothetical protein Fot_11705 [Forsythia ovata]|uniref:Uncharacterized protein n=1 Tax=Forsythia ovata TaxID=205694 RepID=A0ABD1WP76_9LAMI